MRFSMSPDARPAPAHVAHELRLGNFLESFSAQWRQAGGSVQVDVHKGSGLPVNALMFSAGRSYPCIRGRPKLQSKARRMGHGWSLEMA